MEPSSVPFILTHKKRRREDDNMDECKKAGVYQPFLLLSDLPSSPAPSPSTYISSLALSPQFETLPLDILLYILSFLPHKQLLKLTYTSKKCKEATFNPALWSKIKLDDSGIITDGNSNSNNKKNKEDLLPFDYFKRINKKLLSFVRDLSLVESTCRNFGDGRQFARSLLWICKNCTALEKLQLDWCGSLLNNDIVSFTQENIHLLHLRMHFNPILVSDIGITLLARLGLERLDLCLFKNITERGLREFITIFQECKSIQRVTVDTCGCIDDDSLDNLKKLFPQVLISADVDEEPFAPFIPPQIPNHHGIDFFHGSSPSDDSPSDDDDDDDDDSDNFFFNDSDEDGGSDSSSGTMFGRKKPGHGTVQRTSGNGQPTTSTQQQNGHSSEVEDDEDNDEEFQPSDEEEEDSSSEEGEDDPPRDEDLESGDDEDTEKEEEPQH